MKMEANNQGLYVEVVLEHDDTLIVFLPTGERVDIFGGEVRVAPPGAPRTTDGKKVFVDYREEK